MPLSALSTTASITAVLQQQNKKCESSCSDRLLHELFVESAYENVLQHTQHCFECADDFSEFSAKKVFNLCSKNADYNRKKKS